MKKYLLQIVMATSAISGVVSGLFFLLRAGRIASGIVEKINHTPYILIFSFLAGNVALFFINLFLIEPRRAPINNAGEIQDLLTASLPSMDHTQDALHVVHGLDDEEVRAELSAQGVLLSAPGSRSTHFAPQKEGAGV